MSSPAATITVAVGEVPLFVAPTQVMSVSVQPLVEPSVTDFEPSWVPLKVNTFVSELVLSDVLVSSVKAEVPVPVAVKPKVLEPELTGTVTFMIVSFASFLLVKVQVMSSPGLTVTVAVAPLPLLLAEPQSTLVSVQPLVGALGDRLGAVARAAESEALLARAWSRRPRWCRG